MATANLGHRYLHPVISLRNAITCLLLVAGSVNAADAYNVQDRLMIMEALSQYSYLWDSKDSAGFANLFTEDAEMERQVADQLVPGSLLKGRAAILAYARQSHQGRLADRQTRHHFSGVTFLQLTAEQAITENMALITHQTAGSDPPFISASGIYRISWQKTDQGWKMTRRILFSDEFTGQ